VLTLPPVVDSAALRAAVARADAVALETASAPAVRHIDMRWVGGLLPRARLRGCWWSASDAIAGSRAVPEGNAPLPCRALPARHITETYRLQVSLLRCREGHLDPIQ
jgi:hypothetical protein